MDGGWLRSTHRLRKGLVNKLRVGSGALRLRVGSGTMGPLDAVIQLLLFVCFGVYVVMGLTFLIMGIIYHSDEGAVGSTGIYLILLGLLMLIIGGIAVFANLKKIWLILFVIELVNVALFLVRCWLLSALPQQALSRPLSAHRCSCSG